VLGDTVGLTAMQVTFGRTLFAAVALAFVVLALHRSQPFVVDRLLLFSGMLLAVHWVSFFASVQASTVAIGLVTFSTCTVFAALLEPVIFRERQKPASVVAAILVVLGVIIMSGALSGKVVYVKGLLLGLFGGFTFAILQLINRKLAISTGSIVTSLVQNSVAALLLLPLVGFSLAAIEFNQWLILVFLGVGCTALAHTLFIYSLKTLKVASASLIAAGLEPVYGIILAALLLSQLPANNVLLGGAIILLTVLVVTFASSDNKPQQKIDRFKK